MIGLESSFLLSTTNMLPKTNLAELCFQFNSNGAWVLAFWSYITQTYPKIHSIRMNHICRPYMIYLREWIYIAIVREVICRCRANTSKRAVCSARSLCTFTYEHVAYANARSRRASVEAYWCYLHSSYCSFRTSDQAGYCHNAIDIAVLHW